MSNEESTERKAYYDSMIKTAIKDGKKDVPYDSNDKYEEFQIYKIPIGDDFKMGLRFNLNNSRILKEVEKYENEIGKKLDESDSKVQEFIHEILLENKSYSKNATEDLEASLKSSGQLEPAIISCDGIIWNGNRRIAVLKKLFKEDGGGEFSKARVVVLPKMNYKDLKRLEHRLQIAKDYKEEYDPISLRLNFRKLKNEGWDSRELIKSFKGRYSEAEIDRFIGEIDLIDEYLDRIGNVKDYPYIDSKDGGKGIEMFTTIQDHLLWEDKTNNSSEIDRIKIKTIFFSIVSRDETTYRETRSISKILKNPETRDIFLRNSPIYNDHGKHTIPNDKGTEKTFTRETSEVENTNLIQTRAQFDVLKDTIPQLLQKVLKILDTINDDKIQQNDSEALEIFHKIERKIKELKSKLE